MDITKLAFYKKMFGANGGGNSGGGGSENRLAMLLSDTLTELTAEDFGSATSIQYYQFYYKKSLISVTIPNSVTSISEQAFKGCSKIENIQLPSGLVSIGNQCFYYCKSLKTITMPDNLERFGSFVLASCESLESVIIGRRLTNIQSNAFDSCGKLKTVVLRSNSVVPLANVNAFSGTPFAVGGTGGTAYVPQALIESYKTATNWSALYEAGTCNFVAIEGSEYE